MHKEIEFLEFPSNATQPRNVQRPHRHGVFFLEMYPLQCNLRLSYEWFCSDTFSLCSYYYNYMEDLTCLSLSASRHTV